MMALTAGRTGSIFGTTYIKNTVPLPADGQVFLGGVYGFDANGRLISPTGAATDNKQLVIARETKDNAGGANDAIAAEVQVLGVATLPAGPLTLADRGKAIFATDDDTLTLTATTGRRVGILLALQANGDALIAVGM